jgi:hypothetical protein
VVAKDLQSLSSCQPEKNIFKIFNFSAVELYPLCFEHFDFSMDRCSRRLALKSPNPTGCGYNPVSGDLRSIWIFFHCLPNSPVRSGTQCMGDFPVGRHPAFGYRSQKIVCFLGKCFHRSILLISGHMTVADFITYFWDII